MKRLLFLCLFGCFLVNCSGAEEKLLKERFYPLKERGHPFLNHLGMPILPGEVSVRINGFERETGGALSPGYSFHLEAGLWERFGLHIANDLSPAEPIELGLQYVLLKTRDNQEGLCLFFESNLAQTAGGANGLAVGLSGIKEFWGNPFHFNLHQNPFNGENELNASLLITKLVRKLIFSFELNHNYDLVNKTYFLAGIKYRLSPRSFLGIAREAPVSHDYDFNSRTLLQLNYVLGFEKFKD